MQDDDLAGLVLCAMVVAFVGGCNTSERIDRGPEKFEATLAACVKNDGLKSADYLTATCNDGARFSISTTD